MTTEQEFFLQILADHLAGKDTAPREGIDWNTLKEFAHTHQVEGIVYFQCREQFPEAMRPAAEQAFGATLYYSANRRRIMEEIAGALRARGIGFFTVKGFAVARYYPKPALRTMGDCDIVVHRADMQAAVDVMRGLGFQGSEISDCVQWGCDRDGLHFELHNALVQGGEFTTTDQEDFFNDFDPYVDGETLDLSFHFLFLLMHLRKHFLNYGVGLRQFMDLAVVIRGGEGLNWDWMLDRLDKLRLLRFARVCGMLLKRWFGVDSPLAAAPEPDLEEQLTGIILAGGVFGFADRENLTNFSRTALAKAGGPAWMKPFVYI